MCVCVLEVHRSKLLRTRCQLQLQEGHTSLKSHDLLFQHPRLKTRVNLHRYALSLLLLHLGRVMCCRRHLLLPPLPSPPAPGLTQPPLSLQLKTLLNLSDAFQLC